VTGIRIGWYEKSSKAFVNQKEKKNVLRMRDETELKKLNLISDGPSRHIQQGLACRDCNQYVTTTHPLGGGGRCEGVNKL
jgi:hypothetical protein